MNVPRKGSQNAKDERNKKRMTKNAARKAEVNKISLLFTYFSMHFVVVAVRFRPLPTSHAHCTQKITVLIVLPAL